MECFEDFGRAGDFLFDFGRKETGHSVFHLFNRLVDDGVKANLHTVALGGTAGCNARAHLEADDDCI